MLLLINAICWVVGFIYFDSNRACMRYHIINVENLWFWPFLTDFLNPQYGQLVLLRHICPNEWACFFWFYFLYFFLHWHKTCSHLKSCLTTRSYVFYEYELKIRTTHYVQKNCLLHWFKKKSAASGRFE